LSDDVSASLERFMDIWRRDLSVRGERELCVGKCVRFNDGVWQVVEITDEWVRFKRVGGA